MELDISTIDKIITSINDDIIDFGFDNEEYPTPLTYQSDGDVIGINYLDFYLWDSENDPREYHDNGKDLIYEDLEEFLKREINKINKEISKIYFKCT